MHPSGSRGFPLRIDVALVAALLLFCLSAAANEEEAAVAVTAGECHDRWSQSEADDTCQNESVTAEGSMCRVQADCQLSANSTSLDTHAATAILATPDQVACLYNFNGSLLVGSC